MKKVGIVVFAFILAGVAWFLISRTNPAEKQEPGKTQAATVQKTHAVSSAGAEVTKAQTRNETKPPSSVPALTISSNQPPASVVDVIVGDVATAETAGTNVFSEPYIKRCRRIAINPEVLDRDRKLAVGSRLNLSLFSDAKYSVTLQVVNRSPQGDLSIGGKLDGEEYGTFVLSTASGVVLARLADPTARKLFLIRCTGQDRTQYAVEIDVEKTPVPKNIASHAVSGNSKK
jgi:hypothetical protein